MYAYPPHVMVMARTRSKSTEESCKSRKIIRHEPYVIRNKPSTTGVETRSSSSLRDLVARLIAKARSTASNKPSHDIKKATPFGVSSPNPSHKPYDEYGMHPVLRKHLKSVDWAHYLHSLKLYHMAGDNGRIRQLFEQHISILRECQDNNNLLQWNWHIASHPRVKNGRLILRVRHRLGASEALTMRFGSKWHDIEQWVFEDLGCIHSPRSAVSQSRKDTISYFKSFLDAKQPDADGKVRHPAADTQRLNICTRCNTEMYVSVRPNFHGEPSTMCGDNQVLEIIKYINLGKASKAPSREWLALTGQMQPELAERQDLYGVFEDDEDPSDQKLWRMNATLVDGCFLRNNEQAEIGETTLDERPADWTDPPPPYQRMSEYSCVRSRFDVNQ